MKQDSLPAGVRSGGRRAGDYGDTFEPWIIGAMSLLIAASFIGVYLLWQQYAPECQVMEYTYCPEESSAGPSDH